jgi:hypothetical protein
VTAIRILLPLHLRTLASCNRDVTLSVGGPVTQRTVLDAPEARFRMLKGTVREHVTLSRRPRVRFFANGEDVTHESPDAKLPDAITSGAQPFMIVGAVAGG